MFNNKFLLQHETNMLCGSLDLGSYAAINRKKKLTQTLHTQREQDDLWFGVKPTSTDKDDQKSFHYVKPKITRA